MRIEQQYTSSKGVLTLLLLLHTTYQLCAVRFLLLRGTIHTDLNIERTIKTVIARSRDGHGSQSRSGRLREISPTTEL